MDAGRLHVTGQTEAAANIKLEWKPEEETVDAFGNVVKIKQQKKQLNNKVCYPRTPSSHHPSPSLDLHPLGPMKGNCLALLTEICVCGLCAELRAF